MASCGADAVAGEVVLAQKDAVAAYGKMRNLPPGFVAPRGGSHRRINLTDLNCESTHAAEVSDFSLRSRSISGTLRRLDRPGV